VIYGLRRSFTADKEATVAQDATVTQGIYAPWDEPTREVGLCQQGKVFRALTCS
jgi:hypothetical protein